MRMVSFVHHKFNAMLGVATVSMAVNFVVMLAGSLIAGNVLGKEGLAGMNVCTPIFAVGSFLASLLSVGSGLVFSQAMGEFDERRAAGLWSQSVAVAVLLGLLMFLVISLGGDWFLDFNGVTGEIRAEAASYLRWQSVSIGLTPLVLLTLAMVYADGDGLVSMLAGACYVFGTLVFSFLFSLVGGHAGGISAGTSLTMVLVLLIASLHLLRTNNHLRFVRYWNGKDFLRTVAGSAPDATIYLCWGLLVLVVNRFVVAHFDETLLAVVALGVSVVEFSIVFDGVGEALIPLGGMYAGERNATALRELANHSARVAVFEGLFVGGVMLAFASQIATIYGFRGEAAVYLPAAVMTIRTLAFAMPFMGLLMMVNTHYLIVGHPVLAVSVTIMKDFLCPCVGLLVLGAASGFNGIWSGTVLGYAFASLYPFLFVLVRHGKRNFPWLVGRDDHAINFAIRLTEADLIAARDHIERHLIAAKVDSRIIRHVMLSIEENGMEALRKNGARKIWVEYFLSLAKPGFVRLIVRDDGVAMETPFRAFSDNRYLNTLNCNRTEHWFKL